MSHKVCSKCGEYNSITAILCRNCGETLTNANTTIDSEFVDTRPKDICPSCGEKLKDGARNCPSCGAFVAITSNDYSINYDDNSTRSFRSKSSTTYSQTSSSSGNGFLYFISVLIPLVGFIVGGIFLASDDEDKKSSGKVCIILGILSIIIAWIFATSRIARILS